MKTIATLILTILLSISGFSAANANVPADHGPGRSNSVGGTYLVKWPCAKKIVTVKADVRLAPGSNKAALSEIKKQLRWISKVSGKNYKYVGSVKTDTVFSNYTDADLTIRWGRYTNGLQAAMTHMTWQQRELVRGKIVMNARRLENFGLRRTRVVLRHELLHSMGVGHSHSLKDLMSPYQTKKLTLGHGDKVQVRRIKAACR